MKKDSTTSILYIFDQKNHFLGVLLVHKFNNLGLALGMALKFYTSVTKGLKLKVRRKFLGLIPTVCNRGKTGRGGPSCPHPETGLNKSSGM